MLYNHQPYFFPYVHDNVYPIHVMHSHQISLFTKNMQKVAKQLIIFITFAEDITKKQY